MVRGVASCVAEPGWGLGRGKLTQQSTLQGRRDRLRAAGSPNLCGPHPPHPPPHLTSLQVSQAASGGGAWT